MNQAQCAYVTMTWIALYTPLVVLARFTSIKGSLDTNHTWRHLQLLAWIQSLILFSVIKLAGNKFNRTCMDLGFCFWNQKQNISNLSFSASQFWVSNWKPWRKKLPHNCSDTRQQKQPVRKVDTVLFKSDYPLRQTINSTEDTNNWMYFERHFLYFHILMAPFLWELHYHKEESSTRPVTLDMCIVS